MTSLKRRMLLGFFLLIALFALQMVIFYVRAEGAETSFDGSGPIQWCRPIPNSECCINPEGDIHCPGRPPWNPEFRTKATCATKK